MFLFDHDFLAESVAIANDVDAWSQGCGVLRYKEAAEVVYTDRLYCYFL